MIGPGDECKSSVKSAARENNFELPRPGPPTRYRRPVGFSNYARPRNLNRNSRRQAPVVIGAIIVLRETRVIFAF